VMGGINPDMESLRWF